MLEVTCVRLLKRASTIAINGKYSVLAHISQRNEGGRPLEDSNGNITAKILKKNMTELDSKQVRHEVFGIAYYHKNAV